MTTDLEVLIDVDGVVFDAVGTLIEPSPPVPLAYAEAARRQGLDVDPGEIEGRFARFFRVDEDDERLGPLATDEAGEYRRWRRIVGNVLPDLPDPDRGFAELWAHFGDPSAWRAFADVGPALDALRSAGVGFVVASNFDGRLLGVVRGLPALAGCEGRLLISSEVGHRKPHRAFYLAACDRLGLPPGRVACVGDDPENDVRGPERAGLLGLLVDRDGRRPAGAGCWPDLASLVADLLVAGDGRRRS